MRSKTLCLLVCLTSCLLEFPTCLADGPPAAPEPYVEPDWFCSKGEIKPDPPAVIPPERKHGVDCYDKPISVNDLKWNLATSFNEQKEVPKSDYVEIDIHRALYIETATTDITLDFTAANKDQCKSILMKYTENGNEIKWEIKKTTAVKVKANRKRVIAVFEPECRLYAKLPDKLPDEEAKFKRLHHLFMRNLKTIAFPKEVLDVTNKLNADRGLGGFIVPTDINEEGNLPDTIKEPNLFFPFSEIKNKYMSESNGKECNTKCKFGKVFKLDRKAKAAWANTFKLNESCEWMTIHLNIFNASQATEISLRHGFVTLPTQVKAYPMDFETTTQDGYEVIVTYYPAEDGGQNWINMMVANRHGRALHASKLTTTPNATFVFSHDECLTAVIGSEPHPESEETKKMKGYEFDSELNLAYRAANDNPRVYTITRFADADRIRDFPEPDYTYVNGSFGALMGEDKEIEVATIPPIIPDSPSTAPTYGPDDTAATKPTPPTIHTDSGAIDVINRREKLQKELFEKAMNSGNKKYKYWAIPAGFATGSFASFLIANIILFIMKRTVLTFWYKAMYKRYGSDTTMGAGTTMGKTGAGETVGGGTTIGGGTTMGGTTAGETGSTTAA